MEGFLEGAWVVGTCGLEFQFTRSVTPVQILTKLATKFLAKLATKS